ncbi:MAG: sugar nucleotide-binding protein, partial [Rhodobacterales bacterium]|nr:sugar nucleotide-binding protein [Rhodobacterales bacterium]
MQLQGGRLGRLLRRVWGEGAALWLTRADWEIGRGPAPALPGGGVVLDLAGVTRGAVEQNATIASAVAAMARARGARLIHVSSAAVYPGGPGLMDEDCAPDPPSSYGSAKLAAERVVQ